MKQDRYEEGRFSHDGKGLGTVTEEMVRARARELAVINGRGANQLLDGDIEQARRELLSSADQSPRSERIPEEDRWVPVAEGAARQADTTPAPDEQTFAEKLVQEGARDAEHEQMIEATKNSLRKDEEEQA
jgi:hypothetical protein